jgi:hypothetical protein
MMIEMTGALTSLRRFLFAIVLVVALIGLAMTSAVNAVTAPQSTRTPLLVTGVAGTPIAFVVSTNSTECAKEPCLRLQRTSDNGTHFTTLRLPPIGLARGSSLGNLSQLIFTSAMDGYASLNNGSSFVWYMTTDGAKSWHLVSVAPGDTIERLVPTHHELYAVIADCVKFTCTNYRIVRSALSASTWTPITMPTQSLRAGFTLAAFGSDVWFNLQGPGSPLLFTSHDEGRTFTRSTATPLASVSGCGLTPTSPTTLWAECPTGMDVSFYHSSDGGARWTSISRYEFSGTGGGAFDPVSSSLAYLNFGVFSTRAKDLFVITDSGHQMTAVGKLACTTTNELVFSDATHGLAICQTDGSNTSTTDLIRTSDGGRQWSKVSVS